jgi:hypothetical protein
MPGFRHWLHWLVTLSTTVLAGCFLLAYLRSHPERLHIFFRGVPDWQRRSFIFAACMMVAFLAFKLTTPRLRHLRHCCSHPPTWFAFVVALLILAGIDLIVGLSPARYVASFWDWVIFAATPIGLVASYRWFVSLSIGPKPAHHTHYLGQTPIDISRLNWTRLETWLQSDSPSDHDFLGNRAIANRMKELLIGGTRSIGIIGAFGAGKSSIINWMIESVDADENDSRPTLIISTHSCWGFETSASAIHAMLAAGINRVAERV